MSEAIIALMMFGALTIVIVLGIPIAFGLATIAVTFGYFLWGPASIGLLVSGAWGTMQNFPLVAVPLFVFMATMLHKLGVIEDLYDSLYKWSGSFRGGLAVATVSAGTLVGAMSGVVAAGIVGLGLVALPQMFKRQYEKNISIGSVLVAGTLGQLIPPSVNMIIYGSIVGVSIGSLFAGGLPCGLLLAVLFCVYIVIRAYLNRDLCPSLPSRDRASWQEKFTSLKKVALPAFLILSVLGTIFSGAATPTEAAAMGCLGTFIVGAIKRKLRWSVIKEASFSSLKTGAMVCWIVIGSSTFSFVFSGIGGVKLVTEAVTSLPGGSWMSLALMLTFLIILGMFVDTVAMILITAPIYGPIAMSLHFDPLWFGLIYMVCLQTAYISPPFGLALFYLKGVVSEDIHIETIYRSALPFLGLQLIGLLLIIIFPQIAVWFPYWLTR